MVQQEKKGLLGLGERGFKTNPKLDREQKEKEGCTVWGVVVISLREMFPQSNKAETWGESNRLEIKNYRKNQKSINFGIGFERGPEKSKNTRGEKGRRL